MNLKITFIIIVSALILLSNKTFSQDNNWIAPKSSNDLINPFKGNEGATTEGKHIYDQMCAVCHGTSGKGNGVAGVSLNPKPANFLALSVIDETDGAIFWKLTEGKAPMASYKELLTEEQRWKLINYIRQLEKK